MAEVNKVNYSNPRVREILTKGHAERTSHDELARLLNKEGIKFDQKGVLVPWDRAHVCRVKLAMGLRTRHFGAARATRKGESNNKKHGATMAPEAPLNPVSKWDVLKAIEHCADLSSHARRSLLDLVWQELNK